MEKTIVRGYKVTEPDGTCKGFLFEAGKDYQHKGELKICNSGFHFCLKVAHCFSYYSFSSENKVFEVEAIGNVQTHEEDSKAATDHIRIVRELQWHEVLILANDGKNNTGHSNTGDWNTGDWNTGDRNTGYSNTGDRNTGAFCTQDAPFPMFDKPSIWTEKDFINSQAYMLMRDSVNTKMWISENSMNDTEKAAHPSYTTAGGYVKDIPFKEAFQNAWYNWSDRNRNAFTTLPNFDPVIFEQITGVKA